MRTCMYNFTSTEWKYMLRVWEVLFSHGLLFSVGCMLETSGTAQSSCTCIEGGKPLLGSNSRRVHLEILPCFTFQRSYLPPGITRSKPTVRLEDPPVADSCRRPTNAGKKCGQIVHARKNADTAEIVDTRRMVSFERRNWRSKFGKSPRFQTFSR